MFTEKKLGNTIGAKTFWYNETESTNDLAHAAVAKNETDGSVFVADNQTRGRGQRSNTWESEPCRNLTFSLIIYPKFLRVEEQFLLSKAISVAVADFLRLCGMEATIKWPNDIYVGNKKICGILIEHSVVGSAISSTVVGVGLNVNQKVFLSDAPNPTSMAIECGREFDREESLTRLLHLFAERYEQLSARNFAKLESDYLSLLYRRNGYYPYISRGERFDAKIAGIMNTGELLLEDKNGERRKFAFKEIAFVI